MFLLSQEARHEFLRRSNEIFAKRSKTNYEKEWSADYIEYRDQLFTTTTTAAATTDQQSEVSSSQGSRSASLIGNNQQVEYGPGPSSAPNYIPPRDQYPGSEIVRPADSNELFVRPETFNGVKLLPRQWLDQHEKAAIANGWSDAAKTK